MLNVQIVINAGVDIRPYAKAIYEARGTGSPPEGLADPIRITNLVGYNPDGSDRVIVDDA